MANPQWENGYTKIANEIIEALIASPLRGRELRIVLFILRKTYGHSRKDCKLSYAEIGAALGIKRQHVATLIKTKLSPYRVIAVTPEGDRCKQAYEFNKNYDEWAFNLSHSKGTPPVPPEGDSSVPPEGDSSKILPLDENNKEKKKNIKKKKPAPKRKPKFVPPNLKDVQEYFTSNGYTIEAATKFFNYYNAGDWHDQTGKPVKNWKQKAIAVWFKPENLAGTKQEKKQTAFERSRNSALNQARMLKAMRERKGNGQDISNSGDGTRQVEYVDADTD